MEPRERLHGESLTREEGKRGAYESEEANQRKGQKILLLTKTKVLLHEVRGKEKRNPQVEGRETFCYIP